MSRQATALLHDPGSFDIGEGPVAVLCLHGLTGHPYEIRPVAEVLARGGMRAVGPTLAGHGETAQALTHIEFEHWLDGVRDTYRGLRSEHDRVMLAGLSLGGLLSLALAAEEAVDALAVIATPLRLRFPIPQLVPVLRRALSSVPKRGSDIRDPAARARHPSYDVMPLQAVYELTRLQAHVRVALPRIAAPILVAHGVHDATANPADARVIEAGVSSDRRELLLLENSAHIVPVDHDGPALAEAICSFFGGLGGSVARVGGVPESVSSP